MRHDTELDYNLALNRVNLITVKIFNTYKKKFKLNLKIKVFCVLKKGL